MRNPWPGWSASCDYGGTVVAITHDRYFLDNVAGWILELDRGEGHPLGRQLLLPNWSRKTPVWPRKRVPKPPVASPSRRSWSGFARTPRAVRPSPRPVWLASRSSTPRLPEAQRTNELFIPPGPRLGDKVVEVATSAKSHGDRQLIDDLSFSIPKGAIVGIIGPNGAGKSTLFRMMSGQEQPDSGSITLGDTVVLASVDQFRDQMNDKKTVFEEVADVGGYPAHRQLRVPESRAYISRFNFKGSDQQKQVGRALRWRARRPSTPWPSCCRLAATCCCWTNRPTIWTSKPCAPWRTPCWSSPAVPWSSPTTAGSSTIATHILDYQDEGKIEFFEGNFTEYEEWKKKTYGAEAVQPRRIKYKRIAK